MDICVLGWYGTETLGDRAILDGIIKIFHSISEKNEFFLGSLYPFFTERTLFEEQSFLTSGLGAGKVTIFDEKNLVEITNNIKKSDIVIMGGGPLMDLQDLFIIRKAFRIARKFNKKTCLFGVGIGPLNNSLYIGVVSEILRVTDVALFRDRSSTEVARQLCPKCPSYLAFDPAVVSVLNYRKEHVGKKEKSLVVVNLREQPPEYQSGKGLKEDQLISFLMELAERFEEVRLVPNHTFFIGGDDRYYMARLLTQIPAKNIYVEFKPKSLAELYNLLISSTACVGMRYHAVLMQTILCGNNYIIDYTEPSVGKISGFIKSLPNREFYNNKYFNYTVDKDWNIHGAVQCLCQQSCYEYDDSQIDLDLYAKHIRSLWK